MLKSDRKMAHHPHSSLSTEPVMIVPAVFRLNKNSDAYELEQPMHEHDDSLEHHIDTHSIPSANMTPPPPHTNGATHNANSNHSNKKSGRNVLAFEVGQRADPWGKNHDDVNTITNADYIPPCPHWSQRIPYCCVVCCCCCWSNYDRQQCSLALLYTKLYLSIYVLSIVITLALLIYDVSNGSIANSN
eukprot:405017_1